MVSVPTGTNAAVTLSSDGYQDSGMVIPAGQKFDRMVVNSTGANTFRVSFDKVNFVRVICSASGGSFEGPISVQGDANAKCFICNETNGSNATGVTITLLP